MLTTPQMNTINGILGPYRMTPSQRQETLVLIDLRLKASVPQQLTDITHQIALYVTWLK